MIFPIIPRLLLHKRQYVSIFRNIYSCIYINKPTQNQNRTYISVPDGLLQHIEQRLSGLEENSPSFLVQQRLTAALADLNICLADEAELRVMLEENTDPEMGELARKDLETLEKEAENIIVRVKEIIVPKPEYDAENALLEVNDP